jgi:hypothetical protein
LNIFSDEKKPLAIKIILINELQVICLTTLLKLSIPANLSSVINIGRTFVNFDILETLNKNL